MRGLFSFIESKPIRSFFNKEIDSQMSEHCSSLMMKPDTHYYSCK